jgi:hypothetical protein
LHDVTFGEDGRLEFPSHRHQETRARFGDYLEQARAIMAEAAGTACETPTFTADFEALRWFLLPGEAPAAAAAPPG